MINSVLITGAAGFIGSNLTDFLIKSGIPVMGIDNFDDFYSREIKEKNIINALESSKFQFREGDIRDYGFLVKCIKDFKPEIIVHLAAKAGVRPSLINPGLYYDVNVTGTLNILEVMRHNSLQKMVFASSSSVYGNNKKVPFSENDNVDYPVSPYAASKRACELLCHTYHHLYKLDIFCLRFFTVYGPRQRPDLAIHRFVKAILKGEPVCLFGDGSTSRDYTYIDDILQGIFRAMERVKGFEIFNLGESQPISLTGLVHLLEKTTGIKPIINYLPMQDGDVLRTFADISKARTELDYNPEIDMEKGIENFLKWFREFNLIGKSQG